MIRCIRKLFTLAVVLVLLAALLRFLDQKGQAA